MGLVSMLGARDQQTLQLWSADGPRGVIAKHVLHEPRPHFCAGRIAFMVAPSDLVPLANAGHLNQYFNGAEVPAEASLPLGASGLVFATPKSPSKFHWTKFVHSSPTSSLSSPSLGRELETHRPSRTSLPPPYPG
jgi:hypothetical protein